MKLARGVVKNRIIILIVAVALMIPAVLGMVFTRINYDMLNYLPADMDTTKGQQILMDDFGKGAFSFIIVEDMEAGDVANLKSEIEKVDHVDSVIWYSSLADVSVPMEILPDNIYNEFNTDDATLMAVFFNTATSDEETMEAIRDIRSVCNEQC